MTNSFHDLTENISGKLLTSENTEYDQARAVWNGMIDRRPELIIQCMSTKDITESVKYATQKNLSISIKAGGHNVAGHGVGENSMMLDLSGMNNVHVDPDKRSAWVDGGATWRDVDKATQAHGLATPGGLISDTGVAGLTLSGGIGWLRAHHGLCIDNIKSVEMVIADGTIVNASENENSDLFWAIRGGGGNFGVITKFEFALHEFGPEVMFCAPIYPISAGAEPIRQWRNFMERHGGDVGSLIEFSTVPESEDFPEQYWGQRVYTLAAVYNGDADEGEKVMQPLRELGDMVTDFSGKMDYCNVQMLFDELMPKGQFRCYWKCHYLDRLTDEVIDNILEGNAAPASPNTLTSIWNFGGATAQVRADATAFGDRSMPYMFSIDSTWADAEDDDSNITWTRNFWDRMKPFSANGRMYLNFPGQGEEGEKVLQDTFGENYSRLRKIKTKFDPQNRFCFNQNIKPFEDT